MADKMSERVLVFPTKLLHDIGYFQGICTDWSKYAERILDKSVCGYMPRGEAEDNPDYKQIIPYVILLADKHVFRYTRGKKGSEERLRALYSIGVGGHISHDDESMFEDTYETALARELGEEIEIGCPYKGRIVGVLNDDANAVGSVHFGIVHLFDLAAPEVKKRESIVTQVGFIPVEQLRDEFDRYETWSQWCIRSLPDLGGGQES